MFVQSPGDHADIERALVNATVVEDDLLDQQVDAIVNAWNRNPILKWLLLVHLRRSDLSIISPPSPSSPDRDTTIDAGLLHCSPAQIPSATAA
jgi:hypothetical protein